MTEPMTVLDPLGEAIAAIAFAKRTDEKHSSAMDAT